MNYWNYFDARPGVEPAGMLIVDDVHLLEGPLSDFFTDSIGREGPVSEAERAQGDRPEASPRLRADRRPCNGAAPIPRS